MTSGHSDDTVDISNGIRRQASTSNDPEHWSCNDVKLWLTRSGFGKYAKLIADEHKIDGPTLLQLTETDLREKPLQIMCLGDIKKLYNAIQELRQLHQASHAKYQCYPANGRSSLSVGILEDNERLISVVDSLSTEIHHIKLISRDEWIRQVESPDTKTKSLFKLAIAFSYCLISLLITAFVMVLVHDRVPDMKTYPPLPDIVLDNLPLIPWAFEMCELIAVCMTIVWFIILTFHKHRVVIGRRMFSLIGTVFLLRCITMLITSLSVPGIHLECRAKNHGSLWEKIQQAYHIWSRLGMSIHGVRSCGDYMFSGHTTAITLLNHFITEYTPNTWTGLHTTTWVLNLFGVFFILAGHEHYSIDVFVAFYISSRMFLYYHTYAYNHANLTAMDDRMRIWFPLGWFFEAGSIGKVPSEFEFPFSLSWFKRGRCSDVVSEQNVDLSKERKKKKKA